MIFLNYFIAICYIFSFAYGGGGGGRPIQIGNLRRAKGKVFIYYHKTNEIKKSFDSSRTQKKNCEIPIRMRHFTIVSINFYLSSSDIGGIFNEDNSELEIAFRNAILSQNKGNDKYEFIPLVRRVDPDDSYGAEKIGLLFSFELNHVNFTSGRAFLCSPPQRVS